MKAAKQFTLDHIQKLETSENRFARGLNIYKLFWIFFIGSIIGVFIEVVWCLLTQFRYERRSGVIYGPFNPVYGLGAVILTAGLYPLRNKNNSIICIVGAVLGSACEYFCSWIQEKICGSVSWNYSDMMFNLNGRINLLYSIFWGLLAVFWLRFALIIVFDIILLIPNKIGKLLTHVLAVFMALNLILSTAAVIRWVQRQETSPAAPAQNTVWVYFDTHYPDSRMYRLYPNMHLPVRN